MKENTDYIFGVRAVIEAIRAGKELNKILIQKGMNKELFNELKATLKGKDYNLQFVPVEKLNKVTANNHQGVVAFISPVSYYKTVDIVESLLEEKKTPNLLVLDRITDVRNFGAIARSAECLGVHAIIIPARGSVQITPDAIKTSAGALNRIPVCREDHLQDVLLMLQQYDFKIVACTEKTEGLLPDTDLTGATAIVMGSEENGISPEVMKYCNKRAKIPLFGAISSFNVSVAAGIVLYEKAMQQNHAEQA
ncbi:23S rRNA (guanosine(2251)-2'-O)-methyltransferase RlmB [Wandonia haliotis]|uniref:23S rRNA (Guanosine(2251)-2'-O)-methyltransferase RlmB n=1 Tax=Wandonia haliotis TaxID=574963 RepID=A0ABP3Y4I1_9FLAO